MGLIGVAVEHFTKEIAKNAAVGASLAALNVVDKLDRSHPKESKERKKEFKKHKIFSPKSSEDYCNKNYMLVKSELEACGFSYFELIPLNDLILGLFGQNNTVESVSINGNSAFTNRTKFLPEDKVVITYHTFR